MSDAPFGCSTGSGGVSSVTTRGQTVDIGGVGDPRERPRSQPLLADADAYGDMPDRHDAVDDREPGRGPCLGCPGRIEPYERGRRHPPTSSA